MIVLTTSVYIDGESVGDASGEGTTAERALTDLSYEVRNLIHDALSIHKQEES